MALACDITRVASLQWSRSVSQTRFSWLNITEGHHDLSHRPDDDAGRGRQADPDQQLVRAAAGEPGQPPQDDARRRRRHAVRQHARPLVQRAGEGEHPRPRRRALRARRQRRRRAAHRPLPPLRRPGAAAQQPAGLDPQRDGRSRPNLRQARLVHGTADRTSLKPGATHATRICDVSHSRFCCGLRRLGRLGNPGCSSDGGAPDGRRHGRRRRGGGAVMNCGDTSQPIDPTAVIDDMEAPDFHDVTRGRPDGRLVGGRRPELAGRGDHPEGRRRRRNDSGRPLRQQVRDARDGTGLHGLGGAERVDGMGFPRRRRRRPSAQRQQLPHRRDLLGPDRRHVERPGSIRDQRQVLATRGRHLRRRRRDGCRLLRHVRCRSNRAVDGVEAVPHPLRRPHPAQFRPAGAEARCRSPSTPSSFNSTRSRRSTSGSTTFRSTRDRAVTPRSKHPAGAYRARQG